VYRYGRTETVHLAQVACIWYGSFGNTPSPCVLVRELGSTNADDLALFTLASTTSLTAMSVLPSSAGASRQTEVGAWRPELSAELSRQQP
jgi:hypothetical protein